MKNFLLVILFIFPVILHAQVITGEANPMINYGAYTYTYDSPFLLIGQAWIVSGGTITNQGYVTDSHYWVEVSYSTTGSGYIQFKAGRSGGQVLDQMNLTIIGPPNPPSSPSVSTNLCGNKVLTRATPPAGETWYWQTTSTGSSTANSSSTYTVTAAGSSTIYLRCKIGAVWSTATATTVTVVTGLSGGTATAPSGPFYNSATGSVTLAGHTGSVSKWQYNVGTGWNDIGATAGLTTLNFSNIVQTTHYRAVLSESSCSDAYSSSGLVEIQNLTVAGETNPNNVQGPYTYNVVVGGLVPGANWVISGGTVTDSGIISEFPMSYWCNVNFTTPGSGSVTFKAGSTVVNGLNVSIYTTPNAPASPSVSTNFCGNKVLTRASSPGDETWYWQTTSTGTSISNSSSTYTVTAAGSSTIYLRSKKGTLWSTATPTTVTVVTGLSGGTATAPSSTFYNSASGSVNLTGHTGSVSKWQYSTGGSWTDISSTAGLTTLNFSNIVQSTEYRAVLSGSGCSDVYSTSGLVTVVDLTITGETTPNNIEGNYTYHIDNQNLIPGANWVVSGGTVTNYGADFETLSYWCTVNFTTTGSGSVTFKTGSTVIDVLNVSIYTTPNAPASPAVSSNLCGSKVLTRSSPPGDETWYWQTTSTGISTSNSNSTYTVATTSTIYLRAKKGTLWSAPTATSVTVDTQLQGGTLNGTQITETYFNNASIPLSISGNTGNVTQWEQREPSGSWGTISSSAGLTQLNVSTDRTREYRVVLNSSGCPTQYSSTGMITVKQRGFEGNVTGPAFITGTSNTTTLQLQNCTGTVVSWIQNDQIIASTSTTLVQTDVTETRTYRAVVSKNGTFSYSEAFTVEWGPVITTNISETNYIKEEEPRVPATSLGNIAALTSSQKVTAYSYADGLGRPVQTVTKTASPSQNDMVAFVQYDALGRSAKNYLPYTATGNEFYTNHTAAQSSFYNGTLKVATDTNPYAETSYEASPLMRVLNQGAPGTDWQLINNHTVRNNWRSNTSVDSIRIWKDDATSSAYYAVGSLRVNEVIDENNNKVITFSDKEGKLLQKHVQSGPSTWLKTLYIYDALGRQRYVLQPEGVNQLSTGTTISSPLLEQYAFQYTYDAKGRLVEKKVPGTAPVYYGYDPLDRLVLVQDGNLRSTNEWFYVKFDIQNRPVEQGTYTNATHITRTTVQQNVLDVLYVSGSWYEEKQAATTHGYSNNSFPTANKTILAVNYYDDYDLDANGTAEYSYTAQSISGEGAQFRTQNKLTASKVNIVGTSTWLTSYIFYDQYGQAIQVRGNNHLSATLDNLTTIVYNFDGSVNLSKSYHKAITGQQVTVTQRYEYDHAGRVKKIFHKINSAAEITACLYEYNELGQLVDKKLHSADGTTYLQSVDFRYSIRGWLKSINNSQLTSDASNDETNDYFGMELLHNQIESGLSNTDYYNGNISAIKWKGIGAATGATEQKSYKYTYDKSDRLTSSAYQEKGVSTWNVNTGVHNESMNYDANGNISSLLRYRNNAGISQLMDDLTYSYTSGNGNRLEKVTDAALSSGFDNGTSGSNNDYTYDPNGNLKSDLNKGISNITFNILGKPQQITFSDGRQIVYTYDASGNKLIMAVTVSGVTTTTHYVGGFVYVNTTLKFFGSPEGRIVKNGSAYEYQYSIADHQGNTRVVFTATPPAAQTVTATFESSSNANFQNYTNRVTFELMDHTDFSGSAYSKAQKLTGGVNAQVGVAKNYKVYPGDKVKIEAYAKYYNPQSTNSNLTGFAAALTSAFGVSSASTGEALKAYNSLNSYGSVIASGGGGGSSSYPKLFVNILLFDKDYNLVDAAWQQIDGGEQVGVTPKAAHDNMMKEVTVQKEGFAYVYISNENATLVEFYVDDVSMTLTPGNVIQYNEYYPFGEATQNSWTRDNNSNNYLYNAASEKNNTTGNYEMLFREYDPILGRMNAVDPMASKYSSLTPYNYAFNDPVTLNDPSGADPIEFTGEGFIINWDQMGLYGEQWHSDGGGGGGTSTGINTWNAAMDIGMAYNSFHDTGFGAVDYVYSSPIYGGTDHRSETAYYTRNKMPTGINRQTGWQEKQQQKTFKGKMFSFEDADKAFKFMWEKSFEVKTMKSNGKPYRNPKKVAVREVAAWITTQGILVQPWNGPLVDKNGTVIAGYAANHIVRGEGAYSYNNFLPLDQDNMTVTFEGKTLSIMSQIHTHPMFGPINSNHDNSISGSLGIPIYNINGSDIFDSSGVSFGTISSPSKSIFIK